MSRVGADLVEAFEEIAAHLRGEIEVESYEVPESVLTPERIREIRRKVARSTKAFEAEFHISARTMESDRARPQKAGCGDGRSAPYHRKGAGGGSAGTGFLEDG